MADKLEKVLEGYKPIPMKRMFYPRGLRLSNNFVDAFHEEYDRLVGEGLNPKSLIDRFGKALRFHVTEERRYVNPVVEGSEKSREKKRDRQKGKDEIKSQVQDSNTDKPAEKKDGLGANIEKWSKDQS